MSRSDIHISSKVSRFSLLLALGLAFAPRANAGAIYDYTGNTFQYWTKGTCLGQCKITGDFTVTTPLPPDFSGADEISPTSFSFTDGNIVLNDQDSLVFALTIYDTDSTGEPTSWEIEIEVPNGAAIDTSLSLDQTFYCCSYSAYNFGDPGTWNTPEPTPESQSAIFLGIGMLMTLGLRRHKLLTGRGSAA